MEDKCIVKPIGHPTKNRSGRVGYDIGHPSKKFILYSVRPIKARTRPSIKINNYYNNYYSIIWWSIAYTNFVIRCMSEYGSTEI